MNVPGQLLCKVALIYPPQNIMISVYILIFELLQIFYQQTKNILKFKRKMSNKKK